MSTPELRPGCKNCEHLHRGCEAEAYEPWWKEDCTLGYSPNAETLARHEALKTPTLEERLATLEKNLGKILAQLGLSND